jgi:CBS domain containing-hemolysin-like protein
MTSMTSQRRSARSVARAAGIGLASATFAAHASFLSGDALDTAANVLSWIVICLVPIIGIVVFWIVHVMPEKIAHRNHHPQTKAIQCLCLLSLVFGGLLWPIAWLWAYTKPVAYKLAYGTDRADEYFDEHGEKARAGELDAHELAVLRHELDTMHARGGMSPELAKLREHLGQITPGVPSAPVTPREAVAAAESERRSA